jgi:uncharacterized protein YkwD
MTLVFARPRLHDLRDAFRRDPRRFAVMTAVAFAITTVGLLGVPRTALAWSASTYSSASEHELVSLTNQARASAGLRALKVDSSLTSIARWRSKDMITRNYFSHTIPGSTNVFHVLDQKGYCYHLAGENIGWNTYPDDVATATIQQSFMNSSGHRANILGKTWDVMGVGAYKGPDGKKMWTVLFADRCGSTTTAPKPTPRPTAKPKPKATPRPATARATPRPTPKPTAKPVAATATPTATPTATQPSPSLRADDGGLALGRPLPAAADPDTAAASTGAPGQVRDATPGSADAKLRIVDPASTQGLLETVVAGIAGVFLGS